MANSKELEGSKDAVVRGIIEQAISALEGVGLSNASALHLLIVQALIRLDDPTDAALVVKQTLDGLAGPQHLTA